MIRLSRTTAIFAIAAAAFLVMALVFFVIAPERAAPSPAVQSQPARSAPPQPPPSPAQVISGNVLAISQAEQSITVGTYRIENGKSVLASERVVPFTSATRFVREIAMPGAPSREETITSQDVPIGDPARITLAAGSAAGKVSVLVLPPPPSQ